MKTEYTIDEYGKPIIIQGDTKIEFEPYFFVPENDRQILDNIVHNKEVQESEFVINRVKNGMRTSTTISGKKVAKKINRIEDKHTSIFGEPLIKIFTHIPNQVPELRDMTHKESRELVFKKTFEADIPFTNRFLINNPQPVRDMRYCILDIETITKGKNKRANVKKDGVSCITCYDSKSNKCITFYHHPTNKFTMQHKTCYFHNEVKMLESFTKFIQHCDFNMLSAYNSPFDFPYIINRMDLIGLDSSRLSNLDSVSTSKRKYGEAKIRGRFIFDMYLHYRNITQGELSSYKLKDVCKNEEISVEYNYIPMDFYDSWLNEPERLIGYNVDDVKACVELEEKIGIISFHKELSELIGCEIDNVRYNSMISDFYLLKKAYERGIVLPSKNKNNVKETFPGAFVIESKKGLHKGVTVLDFTKMYPSIVKTFNISPETKGKDGIVIDGISWATEPVGFLPSIIDELFDHRDKIKGVMKEEMRKHAKETELYKTSNRKQIPVKYLTNTLSFGYFGDYRSRLYDKDIAKTITYIGRFLTKSVKEELERMKYNVIAGDTDSIFLVAKNKDIRKESIYMKNHINKFITDLLVKKFGVKNVTTTIDFEKIYKKLVLIAKKNYIGWCVFKDDKECDILEIKGIGQKRKGDNSKFSRDTQYEISDMILRKNASMSEVSKYERKRAKEFYEQPYSLISIPQTITKKIGEYGLVQRDGKVKRITPPPKIQGIKWANVHLNKNYDSGSRFYMLYVSSVKKDGVKMELNTTAEGIPVICFDEDSDLDRLDIVIHPCMIEKTVTKKVKPILECFGGKNETSIEKWL